MGLPMPTELSPRLAWLVRLRWVAVAGIVAVALVSGPWLGLLKAWVPVLVIAGVLAAANVAFHRFRDVQPGRAALLQIGVDLLALTFLLHYSGSVENPFLVYYVFHVIIGSILLTRAQSYLVAAGAAAMVVLMAVGEGSGACPHHSIGIVNNWSQPTYLLAVTGVLVSTLFIAAFLATTIMQGLREKEGELGRLHDQLAQTEKLAAIGQLATGVAHELNTPLASIAAYAEEMSDLVSGNGVGEKMRGYADTIRKQTERCKGITQGLLNFARPSTLKVYRVDVNYVVAEALEYVQFKRKIEDVRIESKLAADLPAVLADPTHLLQVMLSVLVNALDAVGPDGRIEVETRREKGVTILVRDDGCGIPAENLGRIFEPFFTTKEVGKGTGLGLSIGRDLLKRYSGEIGVESAAGKGTTVTITLPAAA
jgi:signal transduction histidine kinase